MSLAILNARTLDPVSGIQNRVDLAVEQGKIVEIVPAGTLSSTSFTNVIDAVEAFAFPGFVDFHTHLFRHGSAFGMDAERLLESGVVCGADMGTAGWLNYSALHECDLTGKRVELKAFINLSPVGQPGSGINEPLGEASVDVMTRMKAHMKAYPGEIVGVKVRISRSIVGELGLQPLKWAIAAGEELGLPVCVHTTDPPARTGEVISLLRPGDIYSHTYQGRGHTILGPDGNLEPEIIEGQRRGVLIEVGNGRLNFNFPVAQQAMAQGLFPDIISSDATIATYHRDWAMWDLSFVASKFMALGMPLAQVIQAITVTPAKVLGVEDRFGILAEGREANIALCRLEDTPVTFRDSSGNELPGPKGIVPWMTIRCGEVVFEAE